MSRGNFAAGNTPLVVRNMLTAMIKAHQVQGVIALEDVTAIDNVEANYESRREYCRISASRPCDPALTARGASAESTKSVDHAG